MPPINGRALHYVFKIGNRAKNAHFFRNVLGMKVLRHEEFKEGCEAQCNGPYDNRWSKTMVGYGPESHHFVIELTYNYGVKSYDMGNDFGGITIRSNAVLERARSLNYHIAQEDKCSVLKSPDGYRFIIIDEPEPKDKDPVTEVTLHTLNLEMSKKYWRDVLGMQLLTENEESLLLTYNEQQASLRMRKLAVPMNRAAAYGRIAFAVPKRLLQVIQTLVTEANGTILKPLLTLDTPGKATVTVVILADPDGHEICFVDEEGFSELSKVEADGDKRLDKYIGMDPFQDK